MHRDAIVFDFEKLRTPALLPEHVEINDLFNTEEALPSDEMKISQSVMADAIAIETQQQ